MSLSEKEINLIFDYIELGDKSPNYDFVKNLINENLEAKEIYEDHLLSNNMFKTDFEPIKYSPQIQTQEKNTFVKNKKYFNKSFLKGVLSGFIPTGLITAFLLTNSLSTVSFRSNGIAFETDNLISQIQNLDYLSFNHDYYPIDIKSNKYYAIKTKSEIYEGLICFNTDIFDIHKKLSYKLLLCDNDGVYEIKDFKKINF